MKTYTEYEPSDINLKGEVADPVHMFLLGQVLVIGLTVFKSKPGDPEGDHMYPIQRLIAEFLNSAQKAGISITKSELPEAFKAVASDMTA